MRIIIVGGGSAGWMAAAALGKIIGDQWSIELVESEQIGTVGVGEATIPQILLFNGVLGLDEDEFIRATKGSFKLGIEFVDWSGPGSRYIHAFGQVGRDLGLIPFHHYWLQARARGDRSSLRAYSVSGAAAERDSFMREDPLPGTPLGAATYAYHFDAGLYAAHLRKHAEQWGVRRHEGRIVQVGRDGGTGNITHVELDDGRQIAGDLFIDCSGFRSLLIGEAMGSAFVDWSHWLPCNRALAVPCESVEPLTPYTRATAREAGWQWRIPLQHRIGNGYVYASDFISDDAAADTLLANLDGKPLDTPRPLKFVTGHRREFWRGNVVALGLASGFLEPLESTSIHLVQSGIKHLVDLLPRDGIDEADVAAFNSKLTFEFEKIRDFLILHYWANERDEPFWRRCREVELPDTLVEKIESFRSHGRIFRFNEELFTELAWLQVMVGQGIMPRSYHPLADAPGDANVDAYLASVRELVAAKVGRMPPHGEYLRRLGEAAPPMPRKEVRA
ncbi:MAG TPA: tryptophan halogenase family protein [Sphingomicrobium sp.]|nr:tryptophan halogenase family protein [Sphingomicrobium sp.]